MVDTWDTWDLDTSAASVPAVPSAAPSLLSQSDFSSPPFGQHPELGLVDIGKAKGKGTTASSYENWGSASSDGLGSGMTVSTSSFAGKGYDSTTFAASANGLGDAPGKGNATWSQSGSQSSPVPALAPWGGAGDASSWSKGYSSGHDGTKGDYSTVKGTLASSKGGMYSTGATDFGGSTAALSGAGPYGTIAFAGKGTSSEVSLGITAKQSSKGALVAAMNAAGKGAGTFPTSATRPAGVLQPPPPLLRNVDFPPRPSMLGGKGMLVPPGSMVPGGSSVPKGPTQMLPPAPRRPLAAAQAAFNAQAGLSGSLPGPPAVLGQGLGLGGKGVRGALPASLLVRLQAAHAPGVSSLPTPATLQPRGLPQPGGYTALGYTAPQPGQLALPPPSGLAPELAALVGAEAEYTQSTDISSLPLVIEKKPKLFLLLTKLSPEAKESHLEQLLEQCGEVHAWRRGRSPSGEPLTFGFAQFGDPEAAWKASVCFAKRTVCKQEIKVLVEEQAETLIQRWREQEKLRLKLQTDEDLDWELERKSVGCKALIDAKLGELYGPSAVEVEDGDAGAAAQRRQELRDKEQSRGGRGRKRKDRRDSEFAKELARVEAGEKRLRREERERDDADRSREEADKADKENANDNQLANRIEDSKPPPSAGPGDNMALREMVDRVQSEPREMLFTMELDIFYLRHNKVLETKLRSWLETKIDLYMGGPQSDLVEYVLRRVNACADPQSLISDLVRYLDDNAEPLVERMWRMLVFELMRNGLALKGDQQGRQQQQGWGM